MAENFGQQIVGGRYQLLQRVGQGAIATAFLAQDTAAFDSPPLAHASNNQVLLKIARSAIIKYWGDGQRVVELIGRLSRLRHPRLVPIMDHGLEGAQVFWTQPFMRCRNLWKELQDGVGGALPAPVVCDWIQAVAEPLDFLHSAKIVHGALKPTNVLVAEGGDIFVTDYGLYRLVFRPASIGPVYRVGAQQDHALRRQWLVANAAYVAPEVVQGGEPTHLSDVYSLAVIAYLLLTGTPPFSGATVDATLQQRLHVSPPPPSTRAPGLDPEVDRVFERALHRDPQQRHTSCTAFASALRSAALVGSRPVVPVSLPPDVLDGPVLPRRPPEPKKQENTAALIVAAVGAVVAVVGLWFAAAVLTQQGDQADVLSHVNTTEETESDEAENVFGTGGNGGDQSDGGKTGQTEPPIGITQRNNATQQLLKLEVQHLDRTLDSFEPTVVTAALPRDALPVQLRNASMYRWLAAYATALVFTPEQNKITPIRRKVAQLRAAAVGPVPATDNAVVVLGQAVAAQLEAVGVPALRPPANMEDLARALDELANELPSALRRQVIPGEAFREFEQEVEIATAENRLLRTLAVSPLQRAVLAEDRIVRTLLAAVRQTAGRGAARNAERLTEQADELLTRSETAAEQMEILAQAEVQLWRELIRALYGL